MGLVRRRLQADELLVGRCPGGLGDGEQIQRLQQVALALPVVAEYENEPRLQVQAQALIVAKVDQAQVRYIYGETSATRHR